MKRNESFYNFTKLSAQQKISVLHHADFMFLGNRKFLKYNINLSYSQIGDFFVETWIDENENIFNIFPFTSNKCLKPYLPIIDISDIYN